MTPAPTTLDLGGAEGDAARAIRRRRVGMRANSRRASMRAQDLYFDPRRPDQDAAWSRGRVALVGDAAFCVSLMAGQGSALAMTAAYVLAGELAKAGGTAR